MSVFFTIPDDEDEAALLNFYTILQDSLSNPNLLKPNYEKSKGHLAGGLLVSIAIIFGSFSVDIVKAAILEALKEAWKYVRFGKTKRLVIKFGEPPDEKQVVFEGAELPSVDTLKSIADQIAKHFRS